VQIGAVWVCVTDISDFEIVFNTLGIISNYSWWRYK